MLVESFYQLIGQFIISIVIVIAILIIVVLALGYIQVKKNIFFFPKITIFLIDLLYSPLKKILKIFKKDETLIDIIAVRSMNKINKDKFVKIPAKDTIIFLPHCLRHRECEAFLQEDGLKCTECGKCSIEVIHKKASKLGYKIYIVPGSSFVKKIVKEIDFKAVVGVACYSDLSQIMFILSDYYPQGALLTKTGCFETKVDMKNLLKIINSKED